MNIFDVIGPVMIGPSSSHTAGAVKIGRMARQLFGRQPENAAILLHGSFAQTGRGHGTDKAIVAGLLDMTFDDPRIRDSIRLAQESGVSVTFRTGTIKNVHPNTARIELSGGGKTLSVTGSSIGGGNILITEINGQHVEFSGQYPTLVIEHQDTPGIVASVTGLLAESRINIASMKVYRSHRGGHATMIIETDQETGPALQSRIEKLSSIYQTTRTKPV